ncbi:MAG: Hpt domain-containing protein [Proteobacteria bacterium]|nr:Hpt domain-containing protein [Pseudomonadota bacterium]
MSKASIIKPDRQLGDKVGKTGGPTPEQAILRALNATENLSEAYQGWAVDDLQDLWRAFQESASDEGAEVRKMFNIAHEVRGQGGSFGFPLITSISDSLCKVLEPRTSLTRRDMEVIRIHILAMKAVFHQGLKGDSGNAGKVGHELPQLLAALRKRSGA